MDLPGSSWIRSGLLAIGVLMSGLSSAAADEAFTTGDVNLRTGPGTGYARIVTLPEGTAVDVETCTGGWCRVLAGRTVGWVSQSYLGGGYRPPIVVQPPVVVPPPVVVTPPPIYVEPPYYRPPHYRPPNWNRPPPHWNRPPGWKPPPDWNRPPRPKPPVVRPPRPEPPIARPPRPKPPGVHPPRPKPPVVRPRPSRPAFAPNT